MALKKITGTTGNDSLVGKNGDEWLIGLAGNDHLDGAGGNDKIDGGQGNDTLMGGTGTNILNGGDGNDTYIVISATDTIHELSDEGTDLVKSSVTIALSANVENLILVGNTDIDGTGNELKNILTGNSGDNILDGGAGIDRLSGGMGNDTYLVDHSSDKTIEQLNAGTDLVMASVTWTLGANIENLTLLGVADLDATGNGLKNVLTGNDGANILDGGSNLDWMLGGKGDDTYIVDNSADKITELDSQGVDNVQTTVSYVLSANIDNLTLLGSSAINGTGNAIANVITGNSSANKLYADNVVGDGLGGGDQLIGNGGNDTLYSGDGDNTLIGGDGTGDVADYSLFSTTITVTVDSFSASVLNGSGGTDNLETIEIIRGGQGDDIFNVSAAMTFRGGAGNDTMTDGTIGDGIDVKLFGDGGNDTLTAGADGGTLDGGSGNDTLIAEASLISISMTGGADADLFQMAVNANGSGGALADGTLAATMVIEDFADGVDHLLFHAFGAVTTAADWYQLLMTANDVADETDGIKFGFDNAGDVLIKGFFLADFSADDIMVI